ncbi:histone deacetylase family protein [Ceratobasidium sp. AG-Ba]|nr:histone deacetylase family protein [Ceratobasidium sp. AG-Ba]
MFLLYSNTCALHNPETEILSGKPVPYLESPERMKRIISHLLKDDRTKGWTWIDVDSNDMRHNAVLPNISEAISRVHDAGYVEYLEHAYKSWVEDGGSKAGVVPETFPHPSLLSTASQETARSKTLSPLAKAGLYCFDLSCPITANTFESAIAAVRVALCAASHLISIETHPKTTAGPTTGAFALTRPPGHHAGSAVCGGYCFFNNAAITARYLQSEMSREGKNEECKVAILDIDYHHGNGTQEIFYEDPSVFYVSLHAQGDYPYLTGTAEEIGRGPGAGLNLNIPLPQHTTGNKEYLGAMKQAVTKIEEFAPQWLIVSLGVDTYKDDPICNFQLTSECYVDIGREIGRLGLPTLFAMEGGYCLDALGTNVAGVLSGFEAGTPE